MSYYFRDKPRFSDRLRSDNSGDDLMESLKRQFDQDSKTFFEPSTTSSRISRERETPFDHRHTGFSRGFPFDNDGFERRGNIRSHLDDLVARHPEFADHLVGPPWGDAPFLTTPRNRRKGSGLGSYQGHPDDDTRSQASGSSAASAASGASGVSSHGDPEHYSTTSQEPHINVQEHRKNTIPQYGLRNTVDIGQHRHNMDNINEKMNRGQRSASAPPENRQQSQQQPQYNYEPQQQQQQQPQTQNQRFVSRVDITPQQQQGDVPRRPMSPKQNQPQQTAPQPQPTQPQQRGQPQSNVRHIPIFVEGRDEPVVPKKVEEPIFSQPQQQQRPQSPPQFHRPSHFNQHFANSRQQQQWPPQYHQQQQFYQQPHHEQQTPPQQTQKPNHYQQQQQQYRQQQAEKQRAQQQQQQQQQQEPEAEPAPKLKQIQPKEPLERVALVQNEVDSLMEQVKLYNGNSRQAKEYMYLDEMLTRELIKLDDIETEGKPNVRQARKNAIKSIQDCIALLESKVPLPGQEVEKKPTKEEERSSPSMETDVTTAGSEQLDVSQIPPIPLPPAPLLEQNLMTEESVPLQEGSLVDEPTPADVCGPLGKTGSITAMETQQDVEAQKRQAESLLPSLEPLESGSEQQLNVDNGTKAVKSPRKERKTIPPKPVSEQPIPLPAPEFCHT